MECDKRIEQVKMEYEMFKKESETLINVNQTLQQAKEAFQKHSIDIPRLHNMIEETQKHNDKMFQELNEYDMQVSRQEEEIQQNQMIIEQLKQKGDGRQTEEDQIQQVMIKYEQIIGQLQDEIRMQSERNKALMRKWRWVFIIIIYNFIIFIW